MPPSSRSLAQSWPYTRHARFEELLRESNAAWFKVRRLKVNPRMPYLLAEWADWPRNIIDPEVTLYIQHLRDERHKAKQGFPLHKYIHHGLSSQAMLFNLVGPLIVSGELAPLAAAFTQAGIPWPADAFAELEIEDRQVFNEDSGQPTSIDLVVAGEGPDLFVESKLVEREFGGCSVFDNGDCSGQNPVDNLKECYLHFIGRQYWTLLEQHGFINERFCASPICPLALYYQFFRELLFAIQKGGHFVLLYDARSPVFHASENRGLMPFLGQFVPVEKQPRLHSISVQQVLAAYETHASFPWLLDFKQKYGL
jgi:hypothetical protein